MLTFVVNPCFSLQNVLKMWRTSQLGLKVDLQTSKVNRLKLKVNQESAKVNRDVSKVDRLVLKVNRATQSWGRTHLAEIRETNTKNRAPTKPGTRYL
ncbi:hypothetical protein CFK40_14105 [Virgibacillus necropolis]|uniref:Uncharacterized protein n=1 Tax=Virgibacillus necropolis TaxID=163877 RepID=A0A221MEP8_9BACI|nr:hypothetical protein CFK40_14105 [Virgibacillus necropolis]